MDTVVLFPGQTLPLKDSDPDFIRIVKTAAENSQMVGLVPRFADHESRTGTLFQIQNMSQEEDELKVQAVGRQRFHLCNALPVSGVQLQLTSCLENIEVRIAEDIPFSPLVQFPDTSINRIASKKIVCYSFYQKKPILA